MTHPSLATAGCQSITIVTILSRVCATLKLCQMAQLCTRPLLNNLAKNLWSRYRGQRAGRSTKTKEASRTYKITQVNPRPKDHSKAKINLRKRHAIQIYLEIVDIPRLLDTVETCAEKVSLFENIVKTGLEFISPLRSKSIHRSEPPWLNGKLKNLIKRLQCALAKGNMDTFRMLRNCVNRERKICRAKYYEAKIDQRRIFRRLIDSLFTMRSKICELCPFDVNKIKKRLYQSQTVIDYCRSDHQCQSVEITYQ
ncbi:hypothetical protein pdam_00017750 [Pocillopora damicornis]|uniref:Uncharacterized protein n=1 Tax=Pocillopora damicornis TaxID=46731 RepID=A0A3M6TJ58_POCDA|nr:hypothetical protein pdam_00017750 [Pocillopora damicornis]